jgi:hypothetical protein
MIDIGEVNAGNRGKQKGKASSKVKIGMTWVKSTIEWQFE